MSEGSESKASDRLMSDYSGVPPYPGDVKKPSPNASALQAQVFYPPDVQRYEPPPPPNSLNAVCSRYAALLCCGLMLLGGVCHVWGFSSEGWAYHDVYIYKMKFGLWRYQQCWDYTFLGGSMNCFNDYIKESSTGGLLSRWLILAYYSFDLKLLC